MYVDTERAENLGVCIRLRSAAWLRSGLGPSLFGVIERGFRRPNGVDFNEPLLGRFFRINSAAVEEDRHVILRRGAREAHSLGQLAYCLHSTHRHGSGLEYSMNFRRLCMARSCER